MKIFGSHKSQRCDLEMSIKFIVSKIKLWRRTSWYFWQKRKLEDIEIWY